MSGHAALRAIHNVASLLRRSTEHEASWRLLPHGPLPGNLNAKPHKREATARQCSRAPFRATHPSVCIAAAAAGMYKRMTNLRRLGGFRKSHGTVL